MDEATTEAIRAAYDAVADSFAIALPDVSFEAGIDLAMVQHFVDRLGIGRGGELLDAGCGTGRMITHLEGIDPSLRITGCDLASAMVAQARRQHPSRQIDQADLTRLPYPDGRFDAVLCWYSIIHTPAEELIDVISELRRVVRPGGSVLLGFHVGTAERLVTRPYGHDVELLVQHHEVRQVTATLAEVGFTVEAQMERIARSAEKGPQGFVLATRSGAPQFVSR